MRVMHANLPGARGAPTVIVDLHLHSFVSDGTLDPVTLLRHAAGVGVQRLSIADHDSLGAYSWEQGRVFAEARQLGLELLVGVELDAELDGVEVHLLGYDVRLEGSALTAHLARVSALRRERALREIEIVNGLLQTEAVRASEIFVPGRQTLMRPHFIHPLLEKNLFASYKAANTWYKQNVHSGVEVAKPGLAQAIELVHAGGGWAVLAHPGYYARDGVAVTSRLAELAGLGLDGVEVEYPYHACSPNEFSLDVERSLVSELRRTASGLGLRMTRGTDCHSPADFERAYGGSRTQ
jgi:3',5'-nucleoside bisphosphate phosphatase